jgi:hypothetical protein
LVDGGVFYDHDGGGSIHGAGIKFERTTGQTTPTFLRDFYGNGVEQPDPTYTRSNTDCFGSEGNNTVINIRYATCLNWGDGGVDTKSGTWNISNVTFNNVMRGLRMWDGANIVIADSIINSDDENIWLFDQTVNIAYYNVLWCRNVANPAPGVAGCSFTAPLVGIDNGSAAGRVVQLQSHPFLGNAHQMMQQRGNGWRVEYSSNGGGTWQQMALPNGGANLGDPRYAIPFDLNSGNFVFRAILLNNGTPVATSRVMDEAGNTVG